MEKHIRHVGLDVDSEKIVVAVAEAEGEVRSVGAVPHSRDSVRRLVRKLGPAKRLRVCYEAGPHGYGLYWQLRELGVHCDVVAPTLVPVKVVPTPPKPAGRPEMAGTITIELPGEVRLRLEGRVDPQALAEVLRALGAR